MKHLLIKALLIPLLLVSKNSSAQKSGRITPVEVYKTHDLVITQVSSHAYVHVSFLQTNDFGYVPCNGLVLVNEKEAVVFDTPTTDSVSLALIQWIQDSLQVKIKAIIPTHFHNDCLGGLKSFHNSHIPSYANAKTIELAAKQNYTTPVNGFQKSLTLKIGKAPIDITYFGEGHTVDNVVGYFSKDNILFGGCLIKELDASKGYLGDANLGQWSATVEKIKKAYPKLKIVVPGHGAVGDAGLLDYTIRLFQFK